MNDQQRDEVARILQTVAADGLLGSRDLDVALDAIEAALMPKITHPAVIVWIDHTLRPKLRDQEWMQQHLHLLKVGHDQGDPIEKIVATVIASAVTVAAGMKIDKSGRDISAEGN